LVLDVQLLIQFKGTGCYLILGKAVEDFCFPGIDVQKFAKLEIQGNPVMD